MRHKRVKPAPAAQHDVAWQPAADLELLRLRATMLSEIRAFFQLRSVLEVDTPLLSHAMASDPYLTSMGVRYHGPGTATGGETLWLQTSPEFAMKRLLAAGSGPIYQICKAFRDGESGGLHNPEFTMLEWYRPGMDHHELMEEVGALLQHLMGANGDCMYLSYDEAFRRYADIDPHYADARTLRHCFESQVGSPVEGMDYRDRDAWLDLILTHLVEPNLGLDGPLFLYDYPASQAALARIRPGNPPLAERFELYLDGIEIANGYHEVICHQEQEMRFERDRRQRRRLGLPDAPLDRRLLAAMEHGLPPCAGVALGLDRLLMVLAGAGRIEEVLSFPLERA